MKEIGDGAGREIGEGDWGRDGRLGTEQRNGAEKWSREILDPEDVLKILKRVEVNYGSSGFAIENSG